MIEHEMFIAIKTIIQKDNSIYYFDVNKGKITNEFHFPKEFNIQINNLENKIYLSFIDLTNKNLKNQKSFFELYKNKFKTWLYGLENVFRQTLIVNGIGFKIVKIAEKKINFYLGFSKPMEVVVPNYIDFTIETPTKIIFCSSNKDLLGIFCAQIKSLKRKDRYRGKGIFNESEKIILKSYKKTK